MIDQPADGKAGDSEECGEGQALQQADLHIAELEFGLEERDQHRDHAPVKIGDDDRNAQQDDHIPNGRRRNARRPGYTLYHHLSCHIPPDGRPSAPPYPHLANNRSRELIAAFGEGLISRLRTIQTRFRKCVMSDEGRDRAARLLD